MVMTNDDDEREYWYFALPLKLPWKKASLISAHPRLKNNSFTDTADDSEPLASPESPLIKTLQFQCCWLKKGNVRVVSQSQKATILRRDHLQYESDRSSDRSTL